MNKHELANQLRNRQLSIPDDVQKQRLHINDEGLRFFKNLVMTLPDDEIIESYTKCSHCGEKYVKDEKMLEYLIANSRDSNDFLDKAEGYAEHAEHYGNKE